MKTAYSMEKAPPGSSASTLNPLAEPFQSRRFNPQAPPFDPADEPSFHNLSTYPFHTDAEFQAGLAAVLGHPDTPASAEEVEQNVDLVLKAQCFYFARRNNLPSPIDPTSYKSWLRSREARPPTEPAATAPTDPQSTSPDAPTDKPPSTTAAASSFSSLTSPASHTEPSPSPSPSQQATTTTPKPTPLPTDPPPPQPRYPTTFNHIVDLITRNQPIPGVETIPDIVLGTQHAAPNTVPPRRKPWEQPTTPPGAGAGAGAGAAVPSPLQHAQVPPIITTTTTQSFSKIPTQGNLEDLKYPPHAPRNYTDPDPGLDPVGPLSLEPGGGGGGASPPSAAAAAAAERALYGGLLGPLKRVEDSWSGVKPIPVQTTTPSWQELAEEGADGEVAKEGDPPATHQA